MNRSLLFALGLFLLADSLPARAEICVWTGDATDRVWSTGMNWVCSPSGDERPPTSSDDAIVATAFNDVIRLVSAVTVRSLGLDGPRLFLTDEAGTQNFDLTVLQALVWSGGALLGTLPTAPRSTLTVGGVATLDGGDKTLSGNVILELTGGAVWDAGRFVFEAYSTLRNAAGSTFAIAHPGDITMFTFQNATTLIENHGTMIKRPSSTGTTAFIRFHNTGLLAVNGGTLALNGTGSMHIVADVVVESGATLAVQGTHTFDATTVGGAGTFHLNNGAVNFELGSTLTSAFLLTAGTFNANSPGFSPTSYTHDGAGSHFFGTDSARVDGPMTWSGGSIGGGRTLRVNGPARITGSAQKTLCCGLKLVFAGGARWDDGPLLLTSLASINNPPGQTFEIAHVGDQSMTSSGLAFFDNEGRLRKSEAGRTTFGPFLSNDTTGTVEGVGTLVFRLVPQDRGVVAPGLFAPGLLTYEGDYEMSAASAGLDIELGGLAPGTGHDQLAVVGSATLGGTLLLSLTDGFTPTVGDAFTILTATDSVSGTFNDIDVPSGYVFSVDYNAQSVVVTILAGTSTSTPASLPEAFVLRKAFPNPFQTVASIGYDTPVAGEVSVEVFDVLGRRVARLEAGHVDAGTHEVRFDAARLPAGVYLVRLRAGNVVKTQQVTVLR